MQRAPRQANELAEEEKRKSESISRFHALADEIEALTPIVLSLLKQKGYPERNEILVPGSNPSIFNRRPKSVVKLAGTSVHILTHITVMSKEGIFISCPTAVLHSGAGVSISQTHARFAT
jgi:hypothetical protein